MREAKLYRSYEVEGRTIVRHLIAESGLTIAEYRIAYPEDEWYVKLVLDEDRDPLVLRKIMNGGKP